MIINNEEKQILAQHYFEKCLCKEWYDVCPINNFYEIVNDKNIYQTGDDKKILEYKDVNHFHVVCFNKFGKETYIKLVKATKEIFAKMGYIVDDTKLLTTKTKISLSN